MQTHAFEALGTAWTVQVSSEEPVPDSLWQLVEAKTERFNQELSRFIEENQATQFRTAQPGKYPISATLATLLEVADSMRQLSQGAYDPAVGGLLEALGYDQNYSFQVNQEAVANWKLPEWQLHPDTQELTINGPVIFDIGGMGKGYWIDQLSNLLTKSGFEHHLVDGGGDMMATSKLDGSGWKIALEWPGKPDTAIGVLELQKQGFAASDIVRRRWENQEQMHHHLINVRQKSSNQSIVGCVAVAKNAWAADQMTSLLSFCSVEGYPQLATKIEAEYLVLFTTGQAVKSQNWPGELFLL